MQSVTEVVESPTTMDIVVPHQLSTDRGRLKVRDIMGREIITASSDDTVFAAARRMSENNISCVVVTDDEMVIGILTDKDILKGIAGNDSDFHRLRIGQRMSSPVEIVASEESIIAAGKTMEAKGIKRLPVVDAGALVGIVTQTDITRGLISISPLGAVSEIMSTKIATIDTGSTTAEAARIMASHGISCLVAMHRQEVAGMLTEKDLLRRVVALHRDPATTQVVEIMSFPIVGIPPTYSVLQAGKKMDTMRLHRLVVMDSPKHVCGIITQTDIMKAVRNELERQEQNHPMLRSELRGLAGHLVENAERLRCFIHTLPDAAFETPPFEPRR